MKKNEPNLPEIFGRNIFELRAKYNISLEELSLKTNIRKNYLERIENCTAIGLSVSHLEKLSYVFNIKEILKNL